MSRASHDPIRQPDERSTANRWTPLIVIAGIAVALALLFALLWVLT